MKKAVLLLVTGMLCLSMAAAWSYPTWDGGSGIVTMQTAEVVPVGSVDLALDYQKTEGVKMWPARADLGIMDNTELWFGYNSIRDGGNAKLWNVGAKYLLLTEPKSQFSLALGAATGKLSDGDSLTGTKAFLAATKNFSMKQVAGKPIASKATLGLLYEKFSGDGSANFTKPYVGIEFSNAMGAGLGLEYRFKDNSIDSDAVFSAVARYPLSKMVNPLWVEIGATNGGIGMGTSDHKVFFGVGYRFGAFTKGEGSDAGTRSGPWGY